MVIIGLMAVVTLTIFYTVPTQIPYYLVSITDRMAVAARPHVTGRAGSIVETLGRVGLSGGPIALGLQPAALEIRPVQQPFTQDPRD